MQSQMMYANGSSNMMGGNNSATTISNKSTSAGGGTVGLWKNSSKLMRDPDQIGSQMMMNGKKLGANNSSTLFGNNGSGAAL